MTEYCWSDQHWPEPTLSNQAITAAAIELSARRRTGQLGPVLGANCRPQNLADAFAIQQHVAALIGDVVGWKCGMPTTDAQGQLKIVAAPLYQAELQQGGSCPLWPAAGQMARVEPEYAYPLLHDLPADRVYSDMQLQAAIGVPALALELIQSRYTADSGASYLDQLADGLFNQGLWLGPTLTQAEQSQFLLQCRQTDQAQLISAAHPELAPRRPLLPLIRLLHSQGIALYQGQRLITGSFAGVMALPMAQPLTLTFAEEPPQRVEFVARK